MKKNLPIIALVIIIIVGSIYAYSLFENEEAEMSIAPLSDFKIKDTSEVTKVVITEKDLGTVTISRKLHGTKWYIEGTNDIAQPYNINLILETAFQIQTKQNLTAAHKETVLKQLMIRHKKVEYYFGNEEHPRKTWFVGNPTKDHEGTYMLLEIWDEDNNKIVRSSEPLIVHKPGMHGTLETRFFVDKNLWKYPGVFIYDVNNISRIAVEVPEDEESYTIEISPDKKVTLHTMDGNSIKEFNEGEVKHYITHYKEIFYEDIVNTLSDIQVDSVLSLKPHFVLTVFDTDGKETEARVWRIKKPIEEIDLNSSVFDTGRAFCSVNGSKELVTIQYFTWDDLLKPLSYFLPKKESPFQYN